MFKHWFYWKYQYNKYTFSFISIYIFIAVSGCVGMGPNALLCPGAYNAAKTALTLTPFWKQNNLIYFTDASNKDCPLIIKLHNNYIKIQKRQCENHIF